LSENDNQTTWYKKAGNENDPAIKSETINRRNNISTNGETLYILVEVILVAGPPPLKQTALPCHYRNANTQH